MRHTRIIVTQYGGPLHVMEEECPEPKKGEVRVIGKIVLARNGSSRQSGTPIL